MKSIILATSNQGKINELQAILDPIICIPQSQYQIEDADECGLSFIENALIKARHASIKTNLPALADDSGLVVPGINGEPGIYSARYASMNGSKANNLDYLLDQMKNLEEDARKAYFYCAIALVAYPKDPTPIIATGIFHGIITNSPAGDGGFGYDPIFFIPEYQCTAAQIPAKIKNSISHRAKALEQLKLSL